MDGPIRNARSPGRSARAAAAGPARAGAVVGLLSAVLSVAAPAQAAGHATPGAVSSPAPVTTSRFTGVPPLALRVPPSRRAHAVRIRMVRSSQALTVTATAPGVVVRPIRISPNDHRTTTLLASVRPGVPVGVRIAGARRLVTGLLTY
jgi:hypothetical protein